MISRIMLFAMKATKGIEFSRESSIFFGSGTPPLHWGASPAIGTLSVSAWERLIRELRGPK